MPKVQELTKASEILMAKFNKRDQAAFKALLATYGIEVDSIDKTSEFAKALKPLIKEKIALQAGVVFKLKYNFVTISGTIYCADLSEPILDITEVTLNVEPQELKCALEVAIIDAIDTTYDLYTFVKKSPEYREFASRVTAIQKQAGDMVVKFPDEFNLNVFLSEFN